MKKNKCLAFPKKERERENCRFLRNYRTMKLRMIPRKKFFNYLRCVFVFFLIPGKRMKEKEAEEGREGRRKDH